MKLPVSAVERPSPSSREAGGGSALRVTDSPWGEECLLEEMIRDSGEGSSRVGFEERENVKQKLEACNAWQVV